MQPRLLLEDEARADLAEAFTWYEQQRPGLGSEFLAEVALVLDSIERSPAVACSHSRADAPGARPPVPLCGLLCPRP